MEDEFIHCLSIALVKHSPTGINSFKHKPFLALSVKTIPLPIDCTGCPSSSWSKKWSGERWKWLSGGIYYSPSVASLRFAHTLSSSPSRRWPTTILPGKQTRFSLPQLSQALISIHHLPPATPFTDFPLSQLVWAALLVNLPRTSTLRGLTPWPLLCMHIWVVSSSLLPLMENEYPEFVTYSAIP